MKYRFFTLLLCVFFFNGCYDDLPELTGNPLEDETIDVIEIVDFNYSFGNARVRINYSLNYDFTENNSIVGVVVIIDNVFETVITDINQTVFVERNLPSVGTRCYQLAFISGGVAVRPTEEICVEL